MPKPTLADKLVVAISSRALFDLSASHLIFTEQGVDAYQRYQIEHEDEILAPGPAFTLVKKMLRLNRPDKQYVEVILLSRNSADTGLRVFNSIKHYGLDIARPVAGWAIQEVPGRAPPEPVGLSGRPEPDPHRTRHRARCAGPRARDPDATRVEHPHRRSALSRRARQRRVPARIRRRLLFRRSADARRISREARRRRTRAARYRQRVAANPSRLRRREKSVP